MTAFFFLFAFLFLVYENKNNSFSKTPVPNLPCFRKQKKPASKAGFFVAFLMLR